MSLDFLWMEVLQSLAVKALFTAPWPAIQCCGWFTKSFAAWDGFIRNAIDGYILAMLFWVHPAEWCIIPQRKLLLLRVFSVRFWYQEIFYIFQQTSGFASQREWPQADVEVVPGGQNISKQHCCWQKKTLTCCRDSIMVSWGLLALILTTWTEHALFI